MFGLEFLAEKWDYFRNKKNPPKAGIKNLFSPIVPKNKISSPDFDASSPEKGKYLFYFKDNGVVVRFNVPGRSKLPDAGWIRNSLWIEFRRKSGGVYPDDLETESLMNDGCKDGRGRPRKVR